MSAAIEKHRRSRWPGAAPRIGTRGAARWGLQVRMHRNAMTYGRLDPVSIYGPIRGIWFSPKMRCGAASADACIILNPIPIGTHHPVRWALSAAMTGPVSGSRPRQMRNDSAACSTSMPSPSLAIEAPSPSPHVTNGVGCAA